MNAVLGTETPSLVEAFKFGVALFAAAGAGLEYDPDWAGRYQAQTSTIAALSLSPTLAYRVNSWFSIGGGLNIMASALETKVAAPRLLQPDGQVAPQIHRGAEGDQRCHIATAPQRRCLIDEHATLRVPGQVDRTPGRDGDPFDGVVHGEHVVV